MTNKDYISNDIISRRGALALVTFGATCVLKPSLAYATERRGIQHRSSWEDAVREAEREGSPILTIASNDVSGIQPRVGETMQTTVDIDVGYVLAKARVLFYCSYNSDYSANGKYVAQVYSIGAAPANTSTTVRLDNVEYTSLDMRTTITATMSIYLTFNDGVHHPVYKYLTPYVELYSDTNTANVRI